MWAMFAHTVSRPRRHLVTLVAVSASALAACGSDSAESISDAEPAAGSTDAASITDAEPVLEPADEAEPQPAADPDPEPDVEVADSEPARDLDAEPEDASADSSVSALSSSSYVGDYTLVVEEFDTMVTVTVDGSTRTIESNALPNHETGEFPNAGNPNTITEQDLSYSFTTEPVFTGDAVFAQTPGIGVNGVTFEPGTAERVECASGEVHAIEGLQDEYDLGMDVNNAHVQPNGQYHYHGSSELMIEALEAGDDLVHVGFAADGFLMYASISDAYSSSYELSTEPRTGTDCTYRGDTIEIDGTTPDGTYVADWVYVEGSGDLDECNGIEIDGEYAYIVTEDYPYIPRCLMGEFEQQRPGGPPPGEG